MKTVLCLAAVLLAGGSPVAHAADPDEYYGPQTAWDAPTGGDMNISVYVYRDLNANGIYDMADRPFAGVAVELRGAEREIMYRSNISGFANFRMSGTQDDLEIVAPGIYEFEVVPPPGMRVTSGNKLQSGEFELSPGSPGDFIALDPPVPVGIAADLSISGRLVETIETPIVAGAHPRADTEITIMAPDGERTAIRTAVDGTFSFPASPGRWVLTASDDQGGFDREVTLSSAPVYLGFLLRPGDASTNPEIADFEQLLTTGVLKVPSRYLGVDWSNFVATQQQVYGGEGYINGTASGDVVAYGGSGHSGAISSAEPFDFVGGLFSVAWPQAEGEILNVRVYRGAELAHVDRVPLSAYNPVQYQPEYAGISRIEFASAHYWQWVCDDVILGLQTSK